MKMKINKACDLSSISVLPPHTRRSSTVPTGPQVSQQLRSQQQSQQSFSQSQHGMFSQLSQNSLDEIVANDQRFGSQERENSMKRISCLAPVSFTREESQIPISRSSTSLARKWSSASAPDYRCQIGEDLEHRIGMMETSLTRFGMILDSIQSDVMQVNKGMKEFLMEMEGLRQKLTVHDSSLLLMNKGHEDIKARLDAALKSISDQMSKDLYQDNLQQSFLMISALPEQIEMCLQKLQNELCKTITKEMQETAHSLKTPNQKYAIQTFLPPNVHCYSQTMIYLLPLSMQASILISVLTKPLHCITVEYQLLCLSKGKATASQEASFAHKSLYASNSTSKDRNGKLELSTTRTSHFPR